MSSIVYQQGGHRAARAAKNIDIDMVIFENIDIDIDIDKAILENIDIEIDIDKAILKISISIGSL